MTTLREQWDALPHDVRERALSEIGGAIEDCHERADRYASTGDTKRRANVMATADALRLLIDALREESEP